MLTMRSMAAVLAALSVTLLLGACGGGSSSSSTSGGSTTASKPSDETKEEGGLVPAVSESPPAKLPGLPPLPKAPKKGIKIINLQCDFTACTPFAETLKASSDALGWSVKDIVFKTGQPEAAMTQAVNSPGVEYITISGIPQTIIEPQLKVAAEKGITVVSCCDPSLPNPPTVPVQISNEEGNAVRPAESLADWMINDSNGKAQAAVVGLPEIPTTKPIPPTIAKRFEERCPECSSSEIPVTGEELAAGTVPAKVVAYLQGHPEIDYVGVAFGGLLPGIPQAIRTAGLSERVQIVGMQSLQQAEGKELESGTLAAWYVAGQGDFGNFMADAIARHSEGLPLPQDIYGEQPQHWLCTPETAAECTEWFGPAGYQEQFEEIWQVR